MDQPLPQPQLYDAESGAPVSIPHDQIASAVASGKYAFLKADQIPVVGPNGQVGSISGDEAPLAFSRGYTYEPPSSQGYRADEAEYGEGMANHAAAFGLGAARGLTLGLSDEALTHTGLVKPETLAKYKEHNPVSDISGNITGAVAPIIATLGAAAPEEGAAFAASSLIPSVAAAKAGTAVTEAVGSAVGSQAAKSLASRIVLSSLSHAAGSAVEGAIFGAGNAVTEHALGDPDLSAEKIASEIGFGALIGGGTGAVLGGLIGAIKKPEISVPSTVENAPAAAGAQVNAAAPLREAESAAQYGPPIKSAHDVTIEGSLDQMQVSPEAKEGILEGLRKLKPNADEITEAARTIDAPVLESQVSASQHVQDLDSMLMQSPSPVGVARQQLLQKGLDQAEGAVSSSLGEGSDYSLAEIGDKLKQSVSETFEAKAGPVKELYDQIKEYAPGIPISDKSTGSIARNIRKIIEEEGLIKGTAEHTFVTNMADGLDQVDNLQKLQQFRTAMARSSGPETRYVAGVIKEKLDNLEMNAIKRLADSMKTGQAKEKILGLLDTIGEAKSGYKALRQEMAEVGKNVLGRSRIYGPQDFLDAIEAQTPEKFANKLFAKNNSRFLGWFNENFPQETKLLMQYQRAALRQAATKDGVIQVGKVFRELDKLGPEVKAIMFNEHELKSLEAAKTYMEALPKNINPSGTSKSEAYRRFFEHPLASAVQTARDLGAHAALKRIVDTTGGAEAPRIHALIQLERTAQNVSKAISSGIKGFVSSGKAGASIVPASVDYMSKNKLDSGDRDRTRKQKRDYFQNRFDEVAQAVSDPSTLADRVSDNVAGLSRYAPKVAEGLTSHAINAAQFLYATAPKNQNAQYTFSPAGKTYQPSDAEVSKWERYVTAVDHPLSVLKDMKHGVLSDEGVEALKTVYPRMYQEIVSQLTDHLTDLKDDLPYAKRLQLSQFFGTPLDAAFEPDFVAKMQAMHLGAQAGQAQAEGRMAQAGKMKFAQSRQSDSESILKG